MHREIFAETLEECERILAAAEAEVETTRVEADAAARRRADDLVRVTSDAMRELTEAAETDRAAGRRERLQAENYRRGAERIQAALTQQLVEIGAEREALGTQRRQLDAALAGAEAFQAEARALHEQAQGKAQALLAAASDRAELVEATMTERIAEVGSTLATLQNLVLDRPAQASIDDHAAIQEFLSDTFREIREHREAELFAASKQADELIGRAQRVAAEITAGARSDLPQLTGATDSRAVLDVVGVLLAETRASWSNGSDRAKRVERVPEPIDVSETTPPLRPPPPLPDRDVQDDTAAALLRALDQVEDPSRITDTELAGVLSTTDRLLGNNATIDGAHDLARALADALRPDEARVGDAGGSPDRDEAAPPVSPGATNGNGHTSGNGHANGNGNGHTNGNGDLPPPYRSFSNSPGPLTPARVTPEPEANVSIDLTQVGFPTISLDAETLAPDGPGGRPVGRLRSLWRSLF